MIESYLNTNKYYANGISTKKFTLAYCNLDYL